MRDLRASAAFLGRYALPLRVSAAAAAAAVTAGLLGSSSCSFYVVQEEETKLCSNRAANDDDERQEPSANVAAKQHSCHWWSGSRTINDRGAFAAAGTAVCEPVLDHKIAPPPMPPQSKLIFLGTGSSTGCPRPLCTLLFASPREATRSSSSSGATVVPSSSPHSTGVHEESPSADLRKMREHMAQFCQTSNRASMGDPLHNKDYRNNPSFLISLVDDDPHNRTANPGGIGEEQGGEVGAVRRNVIIDVGKTFREGALRWLPEHGIRSLDAIVLTHQHMDAAAGLDDVRGFQKYEIPPQPEPQPQGSPLPRAVRQLPMPLFLSSDCLSSLQDQFPWLLPKAKLGPSATGTPSEAPVVTRHVASFDVTVFDAFRPFQPVPGLSITPLPLIHGEDLISYGFAFTVGGSLNVLYLSDISRMRPDVLAYIQTRLPQPTHVLVVDALLLEQDNPVHYSLPQAMALVAQLRPRATYLVGMNCDSFLSHDEMNQRLRGMVRAGGGTVQLAYDGLAIPVPAAAAGHNSAKP